MYGFEHGNFDRKMTPGLASVAETQLAWSRDR